MAHRRRLAPNAIVTVGIALTATTATAQDDAQSLAQAASDPTASLMSFQLQDFWSVNLHGSDESRNLAQFRAAIPFEAFGYSNIARLTLPAVTDGPGVDAGLADATLFNLVTFDRDWGRFGVGAVALLPTGGETRGAEQWALGPAAGFVARPGKWLLGAFTQNLFTVAGESERDGVTLSTLQPIVTYALGDGWSVGASDMTFVYDWEGGELASIPLGVKISKLTRALGPPVQIQLSYERNFFDDRGAARDTLGLTLKLLLPK